MGCVLDETGTDEAECSRKVTSGRRVTGVIKSLVYTRSLQFECDRVLHESLLISVLAYGSEVIIWREKEWSRIGAVHMDNLRGLLAIIRMDKVPNALIRELCGVTKGVDEKTDESVLRWLGHVEIMENDKITKKLYVG